MGWSIGVRVGEFIGTHKFRMRLLNSKGRLLHILERLEKEPPFIIGFVNSFYKIIRRYLCKKYD